MISTTCDQCNEDLTDAGPNPKYLLSLTVQKVPNSGGMMNAVYVKPPISRVYHFCSLKCLWAWSVDKTAQP